MRSRICAGTSAGDSRFWYRNRGLTLAAMHRGAHDAAVGERQPLRAPGLHQNAGHGALQFDARAVRRGLARDRLRDRAHAADRVAPGAGRAVDLADGVMQQHVGAARRVRAREVADDRIKAVGGLDQIVLEPAIQDVAGAAREQLVHRALRLQGQGTELPARRQQ